MSRVLITGMTSAQTSLDAHRRNTTYAGLMHDALVAAGHDVEMRDPQVSWDSDYLDNYDVVLVGVSALTGLPANRAYGALNVIERLWLTRKLCLFVDAAEPAKIGAGLRAIMARPEDLIKPFFKNRKDYNLAITSEHYPRLVWATTLLSSEAWPTTIVPWLPWHSTRRRLHNQLPPNALENVRGINLDAVYRPPTELELPTERRDVWLADRGGARWRRGQNTRWMVHPVTTERLPSDAHAIKRLAEARGMLLPPWRDGTWWSPRVIQALLVDTPVVTEWRETVNFVPEWGVLTGTVEEDTDNQLVHLQRDTYLTAVSDGRETLTKALGLRSDDA